MDIVTGGAGMLGGELTHQLLRAGREVCTVVRPSRECADVRKRQLQALARMHPEAPLTPDDERRLMTVQGDVKSPLFGLTPEVVEGLRDRGVQRFWHCAADLRHDPRFERDIRATNIEGVGNAADLAAEVEAGWLHHVGTAYISPIRDNVAYEEPLPPGHETTARNLYEESKILGERMLLQRALTPYTIHRTTTLIGPSCNGAVSGTTAYFGLLRGLYYVHAYIRENGNGDWDPRVGFRLPGDPALRLNMVPVDFAASEMQKVAALDGPSGQVFHIADGGPLNLAEHLELSKEVIDWTEFRWEIVDPYILTPLERAFIDLMADFQVQYFQTPIRYDIRQGGRQGCQVVTRDQLKCQIVSALGEFTDDVRTLRVSHFALRKRAEFYAGRAASETAAL